MRPHRDGKGEAVPLSTEDRVLAGRYRLAGKLGTGGMAEVHRGWDLLLRRYVAVKLFDAQGDVAGGVASTRFDHEVRTMAALSHPGLVSVYDAGTCGRTSYVVLQLVEGCTLRDRLAKGPVPTGQVRRMGARLADALAHVHERGVVHRDVKPSNILLDASGAPHLADFGLARSAWSTQLTNHGQVIGTASYLAPEQVRGEEVGPPADVYALGLVLLECLTGRREYQGNRVEAAVARLRRPPVVPPHLPPEMHRLLTAMTSLSPHRRPTAAQCVAQLRRRPRPAAHPAEARTDVLPAVPKARTRLMIAGAAVVCLVGGAWAVADRVDGPGGQRVEQRVDRQVGREPVGPGTPAPIDAIRATR
ncbi:serine/threonine-protein kinase [Saccharothrix longispora]|uniref:non-specific serine/threonine protein kinase n=1 Tax=Saccharothrix longispora TaxID=33920 RepID=A0ABU1PNW8_9PSEU|nr:serine/threonine-protein kinase [Saccharothrix longispora]MDR6592320.1 serine/threonine protein kinase [Saccharothrix longispora]